jgi:hypothetical protein
LWASGCSGASEDGRGARTFASPEEAVEALTEAGETDDTEALQALFGQGAEDLLSSGDSVSDRNQREVVTLALRQRWNLEETETGEQVLVIGYEEWPFPVPLVQDQEGWRFDIAAGKEEVLARRIGRHELRVIETCLTYVRAQEIYASRPHDDQPAGLYAQRMVSREGKQDGLYWRRAPGERPSPLGDLFAQAAEEGYEGHEVAEREPRPYNGYYFHILTAQGEAASGGARSYVQNGDMVGGFALVAYPAEYGDSGIMTFVVNQDGIVYEKDLGERTEELARAMTEYSPDASWEPAE